VVVLIGVTAIVVVVLVVQPGASGRHRSAARVGAVGGRTTASTTTLPVQKPLRNLAVTSSAVAIVDTSRPLTSGGVTLSNARSLPTDVWRPSAPGRYPLVVFVHGYDVGPLTYQRFLSTLASSGYVVAGPSFPLEDPSRGNGLDRTDLPNEATDVSFVITTLLAGPLVSRIQPSEIAVVGHSDGADVALMVGYQQGLVDPRVRAVVSDAPDPMTGVVAPSSAPLLLLQGNEDSVVPYASSQRVFQQVRAPRYYLTLLGADHLPPIQGGTPWTPVLDTSVAEFLNATIGDRGPGRASLPGELAALPLGQLLVLP
jgi:pimeloyl-ACP methyl ester carboxylesterase